MSKKEIPKPDLAPDGGEGMNSFRIFLKTELSQRKISLRHFARTLSMEPSILSKILNGKREVTLKIFDRVAAVLEIEDTRKKAFRSEVVGSRYSKMTKAERLKYVPIPDEAMGIVAKWYHFAILEMFQLDGFRGDPAYISRMLGLQQLETDLALENLMRLGLIGKNDAGEIINLCGNMTTFGELDTAEALKELQRSVLRKALEALDSTDIKLRDQTSMTFATDAALLPEAKRRITKFRRGLTAFLETRAKKKNAVFHLGMSLYPVTSVAEIVLEAQ